ncbi:MAG: (2E,6E)-farnesyl diphosphate synthase [Methylococcaceae bacterium]|nr:(2E,6E)-farnesyl diphosphate synthase [Methylococcaceae bacterium]
MNPDPQLKNFMTSAQQRVDKALDEWLPPANRVPYRLHEAMRYSVLNGGKRMRPILTYGAGRALGISLDFLNAPACAVELIHAYSLVHDDLPAMDDDDLRRGKATCHVAFDEATAILAGDGLQTLAFQVLASDRILPVSDSIRIEMINILAQASGSHGMVGGQAIDLDSVGKRLDLPSLENMHIHKTGALIRASIRLASCVANGVDEDTVIRLDHYAKCIGLSFQIRDDILDEESDTQTLGKTRGKDRDRNKPTYPGLLGMSGAKQKALDLHEEALDSLCVIGADAEILRSISLYIIERRN